MCCIAVASRWMASCIHDKLEWSVSTWSGFSSRHCTDTVQCAYTIAIRVDFKCFQEVIVCISFDSLPMWYKIQIWKLNTKIYLQLVNDDLWVENGEGEKQLWNWKQKLIRNHFFQVLYFGFESRSIERQLESYYHIVTAKERVFFSTAIDYVVPVLCVVMSSGV